MLREHENASGWGRFVESHRSQENGSNGRADESRGQTNASMLTISEMVAVDDGDSTGAKSDAGDATV